MAALSDIAMGVVGQRVLRRAKFSWLAYGVGAYVALRLMKRYGVGGRFPDRALSFIDENIGGFARRQPIYH